MRRAAAVLCCCLGLAACDGGEPDAGPATVPAPTGDAAPTGDVTPTPARTPSRTPATREGIGDPAGDVVDLERGRPADRPAADITGFAVSYGARIELAVTVAEPRRPRRWDAFDLVRWELDTSGDERPDVAVEVRRYEPGPRAEVRRHRAGDRPGNLLCQARLAFDGEAYRVAFPPGCIGAPEAIRARVTVEDFGRLPQDGYVDHAPGADDYHGPVRRK